jgi:hypothetical protein
MKITPTIGFGTPHCAHTALPPVTYEGLRIVFANGNWVGLKGIILHDLEGNSIMPMTRVNGGASNDFDDISAGQYTFNSSYGGGDRPLHQFYNGSDAIQWSTSGASGGLTLYVKFAAPQTLSAMYAWFDSVGSYGLPTVSIYDTTGNAISIASAPANSSAYTSDLPANIGYKYTVATRNSFTAFGSVNGTSSYLDGAVAGVCGQFDATISASYNGSGGT